MTPLEALRALVSRSDLRWHYRSGNVTCSSCGAVARENDFGVIVRVEACGQGCPWRQAEEAIALAEADEYLDQDLDPPKVKP